MSCGDYRDKILGWGCDFQYPFLQWAAELQLCHFVRVFLGQTLSTNIILCKLITGHVEEP